MSSATYEFNARDADLVVVSCQPDPAEFRVHRCILAAASPFFSHMLGLPQPVTPANLEEKLPVIPVSESRTTVDTLLRFVYPVPDPELPTLDDLSPVLGAAVKYDFTAVISTLGKLLVSPSFLRTSPTRVFAIASRYELEDEARIASRFTLNVNILDCPLSDDLKHITAYAYHRLLDLHRRRARAAQELLKLPEEVKCMQCNGSAYAVYGAPKWWNEYERRAREELAARPTSDVIFNMAFLARTASATGCQRCPGSILDSFQFLDRLKLQIDALPATI